jgi:hypothetical protein
MFSISTPPECPTINYLGLIHNRKSMSGIRDRSSEKIESQGAKNRTVRLPSCPGRFFLALLVALRMSGLTAGEDQDRRKKGVACLSAWINAGIEKESRKP